MNRRFDLRVNGEPRAIETEGERSLLEVLREDLGLTGSKYGCGEGRCRACTVPVDGTAVTSCRYAVSRADCKDVRTIEELKADGELHPVQEAFVERSAMQCGYCVPGIILTTGARRQQLREQGGGTHDFCQNHARLHFGLGPHDRVERIDVSWPGGATQVLEGVAADRLLTLVEPDDAGTAAPPPPRQQRPR